MLVAIRVQSGFTKNQLFMSLDKWFPNTKNPLLSAVNEDSNALKATSEDEAAEFQVNKAEQERMEKVMKFDQLVGLEREFASAPPPTKTKLRKFSRIEVRTS